MKLFCNAFAATLEGTGIKGNELSAQSSVSAGAISNFRNDVTGITTDNLERLVAAFSDEAFSYWVNQLVALRGLDELKKSPMNIRMVVDQLDGPAAAEFLIALAARLRREEASTAGMDSNAEIALS